MEFRDPLTARDLSSVEPPTNVALSDLEHRYVEMIRLAEMTQQMPLVLAQISQQLQVNPPRQRRMSGLLAFPLVLVAMSILSAVALPWMFQHYRTQAGKGKTARAEDSEMVLNATCIMGNQRTAVINGRTYKPKDTLRRPNSNDPPYVITDILPHKVLLECNGKHLQLRYTDTVAATRNVRPAPESDSKPPLPLEQSPSPVGSGKELSQLLEKMQKGELGFDDIPQILSALSSQKSRDD